MPIPLWPSCWSNHRHADYQVLLSGIVNWCTTKQTVVNTRKRDKAVIDGYTMKDS
jgi:hypothetical protein